MIDQNVKNFEKTVCKASSQKFLPNLPHKRMSNDYFSLILFLKKNTAESKLKKKTQFFSESY